MQDNDKEKRFEAARVRHVDGKEKADMPQRFETAEEARAYVSNTPLSSDKNRPWIRDVTLPGTSAFLMVGGRDCVSPESMEAPKKAAKAPPGMGF